MSLKNTDARAHFQIRTLRLVPKSQSQEWIKSPNLTPKTILSSFHSAVLWHGEWLDSWCAVPETSSASWRLWKWIWKGWWFAWTFRSGKKFSFSFLSYYISFSSLPLSFSILLLLLPTFQNVYKVLAHCQTLFWKMVTWRSIKVLSVRGLGQ